MSKAIRAVISDFDPRVCAKCRHNRITCRCRYPFPSTPERGLYSRALYEADLESIERMSATISSMVADRQITGVMSLRLTSDCEWMKRLCKAALFKTMMILASKNDSPAQLKSHKLSLTGIVDKHGVRLSSAETEHIRRMATDSGYRAKTIAKEIEHDRQGNCRQP